MPLNAATITTLSDAYQPTMPSLAIPALLTGVATAIKAAAVADLNQDISASYTEAEVQAISDKVDELLAALRAAGLLAT